MMTIKGAIMRMTTAISAISSVVSQISRAVNVVRSAISAIGSALRRGGKRTLHAHDIQVAAEVPSVSPRDGKSVPEPCVT